ncbi:uncharacterized protein LOC117569258 isoform X14 [Drosophila albomicans]|uniref:Uncharacterized protein LOC117569258 isoform X14 n=1 Tax=Drosophila albomicans TaxID=7291 RepID=A0A9C6T7A5_DROAB|nr:uncharacterized protein LOC117569258 isoform X14 [Drosophila albomicans]
MGAKHSKQQREQQQQQKQLPEQHQQQQQKELPQEQQQQQQQTPKAPGSPRQAKVIVHRIVREEVDEVDGTQQQQQQQQQQQPQLQQQQQQQQPLKFQHQHEQLPQQQPPLVASQQSPTRQQPAPATLPQQRSTKVIIHQIRVETDEEERARKGKPTIEEISSTTATSAAGTAAATMHSNSNGSIPSSGTLSPPPRYLVESPSPKTPSQMAQFGRFARDVQIQELELNSDCSSGEFNFNGMQSPVVCEVDSEVEAEPLTPQQPQAPTTAVATFSPDVPSNSRAEQQEQLRQRRVQKRVALESHFLPQLLSPRYLDSILEENSETTASGHELALSRSSSNDPSHTRAAAASVPAKANESFPRSQLDFSRRHRRREEPVALMLETKLLDQPSDLESCTRLQSTLSPQSEDAELVYLSSSASSSVSDLMELELEQAAALAERALIDLDTDASKLINRPNDSERYSPATTASTTEPISSANETETEGECEVETEVDTETETNVQSSRESTPVNAHRGNEEPTLSPSPGSSLSSLLSAATTPTPAEAPTATPTRERATTEAAATSTAAESNEFGLNKLANSSIAASSLSATREEFVRNMEKVRELIEMTRREEENVASNASAYLNGNGNDNNVNINVNVNAYANGNGNGNVNVNEQRRSTVESPSPPPVPPPPSSMHYPTPTTTTTTPPAQATHVQLTSLLLKRQESNDSHCSDSTQHSQCTAIHMASPPPTNEPPTPPIRQQQQQQQPFAPPQQLSQQQQQPSQPQLTQQPELELSAISQFAGETEAERIKKLRLLCTETLASMPYGEQMLEELASVAQNITDQQQQQQQQKEQQQQQSSNNMPYPLPHLPHISELQLSLGAAKNDAWLGLPTQADPKLLVCLSPGQRALVEQQSSKQSAPDQLLDAHEKFVQRRGYHELSAEQVRAMDSEQLKLEQEQMLKTAAKMRELRKSLTPQPEEQPQQQPQQQLSPVPPPVPVKSAETAAKAKSNQGDDVSQQVRSSYQKVITSATSSFENKPTAADQQQQQPQLAGEKLPHSFDQRTSSSTEQQQQTRNSSYMSSNSSNNKFPASMESELARMFPSIAQQGDIFDEQRKRFSNIEQSVKPAQTKRYSNIETSSFESKKRVENGQVVYDYSNSSREHQEEGEKPQTTATTTTNGKFPLNVHQIPVRLIEDEVDKAPPVPPPPAPANIMSATKLNGKPNTFIDDAQQQPQQQQLSTESNISRSEQQLKVNSSSSNTYEEFRQRAKAAIEAIAQPNNSNNTQPSQPPLDNEKLFKDFDALSQQLNAELQTSRVQREQRDKSASLYDLSRLTQHSNNQSQQQLEQLQQRRHAHMQELEREIERSARSRQERLSSVPRSSEEQQPVEYRARRAESLCNLQQEPLQRPHSSAEHYRVQPQQQQQDDWSRYASDLGYSENIARPFAREVEICYQRQHQRQPLGIRAPRLSMSTNDLSSSSYDSYNAYGGARRHAPMLQQAPQQQRPHYASCYSMIERDPNPTYISTTSRRGVSPAPPAPVTPQPPAYDRQQRRASLPRELHEQQLKYILSKEEELKLEFERLQQERRRLMDEMQRAPTVLQATPPRRDSYRPAPKLPTLSEDEVFRQQMAEEWMNKVAEREERRQHKIIKISKIEDEQQHATEEQANISDEFLNRVKERRHKLAMPADSDWESGAESQPNLNKSGQAAGSESSDVEAPPMRVLEGKAEANLRELPRHLREFAKFASSEQLEGGQGHVDRMEEQERSEMITDNSHSSASKKSSIVKTYKVSRLPPSVQAIAIKSERPRQQQQEQEQQKQQQRQPQPQPQPQSAAMPTTTPAMTAKLRIRPQKQTRFLLSPQQLQRQRQRRSWSESDLLKEIDNELQLAKGFLFANEHTQNTTMFAPKFKARAPTGSGVWTPKSQTPHGSSNDLANSCSSAAPTPPPPPSQPVWTPQPSPALSGRKEFRPVRFESPTLPRRYTALQQQQEQQQQQPQTTTIPPWSYTNGATTTTLSSNNSDYAETDCSTQFGPVAPSASVSDKIKTFERSASTSELNRPFVRRQLSDNSRAVYRPNEVIYKVKHEYLSEPETEYDRPRKMAQLGRRQYEGIGPVTNDGMPIILRSEVQEPHQHEWYKRLYQTIHKQKNGDDYVIRYKCPRARPSYKSNGYVSEPEPNYDSDYSTLKYRTPNPLRVQSVSSAVNVRNLNQDDKLYGTMPNPIKSASNSYKNQPGRIENYTTGHSSVSEKEKKEWWDEVMDIFNGNLEQSKLSPLYTEGNLSRALAKESGYTSDSNLVFRKKELPVSSPLSPVEQRQAYKSLQAGGEPPLLGFRKPAPEKPKDFDSSAAPPIPPQPPLKGLNYEPYSSSSAVSHHTNGDQLDSDVNVHFKTPLRHEYKQNLSEEELAIRQAEHMQKLYQEERRRKYLQELQDMNSRRHTDNFTPSQKSPIALNRYDDFPTDVTLKSLVGPKTVARALYNFQGQSSKELSFRKGDVIYIRRQIDPNWYEGEHNAMIGLLPASYVEIVSRDGARTPSKRPSEGQARAKYNFQAQSGVELSLNKGELVTLTRRVDGNWFEGKIANRKGIFPVSYVEVLTDIGAEDIAARTTTVISSQSTTNLRPNLDVLRTNINNEFNTLTQNGSQPPNGILKDTRTLHKTDALHVDTSSEPLTYRALYKYRPQNSDELELFEGDLVHVLEKCDDGWFVGTSQRTGCFGTFPGNYVERA